MKKISLFLSALFISAISMAAVVTFDADADKGNAGTDHNNATAYQITKDGITLDVTQGIIGTFDGENHYRIYKNQTLTITSTVGNITKVEFTCTAKDDAKYGPGGFTVDCGSYTYSGSIGTWSGSTEKIVFTPSKNQVRASQIVITYEEPGTSSVDNVVINKQATKFFENGQLVIMKDGIRYNAQGQVL